MKVETAFGSVEVTDIPHEDKLTSVNINMQDQVVELTYRGFIPYGSTATVDGQGEVLQQAPDAARYSASYDGELDNPDAPGLVPQSTVTVFPPVGQPGEPRDVPGETVEVEVDQPR